MKKTIFLLLFCLASFQVQSMQILVRMPIGKTITLEVQTTDSIFSVKQKIQYFEAILPNQQELRFATRVLLDDRALTDYNIQSDSLLYLTLLP